MLEKGRVNTFKVKFSFVSSPGCPGGSVGPSVHLMFAVHQSLLSSLIRDHHTPKYKEKEKIWQP